VRLRWLLCTVGCTVLLHCGTDTPVTPAVDNTLALHVLQDSTRTIGDALALGLNDLTLAPEPLLSADDIIAYDYSSHTMYLQGERADVLPYRARDGLFPASWWGRPFVVLAGGSRQYIGSFVSVAQLPMHQVPYIQDVGQYPSDVIHISWIWPFLTDRRAITSMRGDPLQDALLRPGFSLRLAKILVVENADVCTLSYTFELRNDDSDALYALDPELAGAALFHFFVNGPLLLNEAEGQDYRADAAEIVSPEPFDHWDPSWFSRIPPAQTMRRTVRLSGYPHLPPGTYRARLRYAGPVNIRQEQRHLADGRYWLGPVDSDLVSVTIDE
jgi:hypothetical protein